MTVERARTLRGNATDVERLLWRALRPLKKQGLHFRRQAEIGPYFGDFACHRAKVIVELDGSQHADEKNAKYDAERTAFLESRGYKVLRFWNLDVMSNLGIITELIFTESKARLSPHLNPSPR